MRRLFSLALLVIVAACADGSDMPPAPAVATDIGVVVMHGKWGSPGGPVADVADAISRQGHRVANIEMPWSHRRLYDVDYDAAMTEIDAAVATLKEKGARRIVICGHSAGANAALGYAATRDGVAGVIVLAPGHTPERFASRLSESLGKAKAMMAAGDGESRSDFEDINQGKTRILSVRARIYLSYFDPDGPAVMPHNAAALKPGTALLWVIGNEDRLASAGRAYAFDRAPPNAASRYVEVNASHLNTPAVARPIVVKWLAELP